VSTANQNIQLLEEITTGDTDGWVDPSTRFETVSTDPVSNYTGFGLPPVVIPTVTIANTGAPAAGDITQDADSAVLFGFSLTPSASIDFTAVSIATAGTADAGDLDNFRLVYDADNDGVFDGGEDVIATVASLANPLVFNTFSPAQTSVASARRYLLVADVAVDATVDATFTASIAAAGDVTTTGDESGTAAGNEQTIISASAPFLSTSVGTLSSFGDVAFGDLSDEDSFTVSGDNLTDDVTVTAPTHFQVSLSSGSGFAASVELTQTGGDVDGEPTTVYVRLNPASIAGSVSGNVAITSADATTQNVAVSGYVIGEEPTTSSSGLSFTSIESSSFTINWTRGSEDSVLVVLKSGSTVDADPSDKTSYSANAAFGSGDEIGTGNRVVYKGTGTSVSVTGLNGGTTYHVEIFEYNSSATAGTQNYQETGLAGSQETGAPIADYVVIAEVYGGGGNSGAPFTHDYVVLYNPTESVADLTGHSLQYASSSGSFTNINAISGSIPAESYFLIQLAGGATGVALPTPDLVIGSSPINMSATNGKVALVSNTDGITGSGDSDVVDFLGFGSANDREGSAAVGTLSNTTSARRKSNFNTSEYGYFGSAWDANENSTDFYIHPLTSSTPPRSGAAGLQLTGSAGWRLLSSPVSGSTYADLLGPIWTQGATGADVANGTPNVFWSEGSTTASLAQTNVTDLTVALTPGRGFAVLVYNDDNYTDEGGTTWPKTLSVTGTENAADVTYTPTWTSGTEYAIAGNPFASTIEWDALTTGEGVHDAVWVWNPGTSTYDAYNAGNGLLTGGLIAPFQGFWIQYDGAASGITFPAAAKTTGGTFRGKEVEQSRMVVRLSDDAGSNQAWIAFRDGATFGEDRYDAVKFSPMSGNYIQLYSVVDDKAHDINALPIGLTDALEIPLGYTSTRGGNVTLDFTELNLPEGWMVSIRDNVTNETLPVTAEFSYTFESTRAKAAPASETPQVLAANDPRFTLIVDPLGTTSTKDDGRGTMDEFALHQNYPNPFNPSTQIRFTLQSSDVARLTVYDLLGREVAVLVNGTMPAGSHSITFDASNLTSGVYIYKLEAGGQVMTKRMTLLK
jgi:hypothetical protein